MISKSQEKRLRVQKDGWPKRPDGTPKLMSEMTLEEREVAMKSVIDQIRTIEDSQK